MDKVTAKTAFQKNNETVERGKQYLSKNCKVVFEVSKTLIERLRAIDVMLAGDDEWDRYCHEVMGNVTGFRNLNIEQVRSLLNRGLLLLDKHGKHLNISLPFFSRRIRAYKGGGILDALFNDPDCEYLLTYIRTHTKAEGIEELRRVVEGQFDEYGYDIAGLYEDFIKDPYYQMTVKHLGDPTNDRLSRLSGGEKMDKVNASLGDDFIIGEILDVLFNADTCDYLLKYIKTHSRTEGLAELEFLIEFHFKEHNFEKVLRESGIGVEGVYEAIIKEPFYKMVTNHLSRRQIYADRFSTTLGVSFLATCSVDEDVVVDILNLLDDGYTIVDLDAGVFGITDQQLQSIVRYWHQEKRQEPEMSREVKANDGYLIRGRLATSVDKIMATRGCTMADAFDIVMKQNGAET